MEDDVVGPDLDHGTWLPHYLPAWSSRAAPRASYRVEDSCSVLDRPDHPVPELRIDQVRAWDPPTEPEET